ncbi:hypothetical protein DFS34DRAFT_648079 [Phlyctochytrium arcticum]|nr:hypothetical protein DFS34DRAFT_648079 [Phlyctochytrium arcticum]
MDQNAVALLNRTIVHMLRDVGFDSVSDSALEIFSLALELYLHDLFSRTRQFSEQSARTKPTLNDLWLAMRGMGISVDEMCYYLENLKASGARGVSGSSSLIKYPYKRPIPGKLPPSFRDDPFHYNPNPPPHPPSIPPHLPSFPNPHTFISSKIVTEADEPTYALRAKQAEQSRLVEDNLTTFLEKATMLLYKHDGTSDLTLMPVNYETAWRRKRKGTI